MYICLTNWSHPIPDQSSPLLNPWFNLNLTAVKQSCRRSNCSLWASALFSPSAWSRTTHYWIHDVRSVTLAGECLITLCLVVFVYVCVSETRQRPGAVHEGVWPPQPAGERLLWSGYLGDTHHEGEWLVYVILQSQPQYSKKNRQETRKRFKGFKFKCQ